MTQVANKKIPRPFYLLILLASLGLGISGWLTKHFYDIRNGTAGFKSFCNVSEQMNCDSVAASSYAELMYGLPVSSFGAGWFLALLLVSLLGMNLTFRREATRYLLLLTGIGSLVSIPYLYIMARHLNTYCLYCIAIDVIQWVSSCLIWATLKPQRFLRARPVLYQWRMFIGLTGLSVFAAVLGLKSLDRLASQHIPFQELAQNVLSQPILPIKTGPEFPSIGPADAPITIVEFSDFQCPWCRQGAMVVNSVMKSYPGKIRVVFKQFPLDRACNSLVTRSMHPVACEAARASYCAHQQGKFEHAYEELFENQASYQHTHPGDLVCKLVPFNLSQFQGCMNSPESTRAILRDIEEGKLLGVSSTPTFFINGRKMDRPYPIPVWNEVIRQLPEALQAPPSREQE